MKRAILAVAPYAAFAVVLLSAVWLAIAADPPLRIAQEADGSIALEWDSTINQPYKVYWNTNIAEDIGGWQLLTNLVATGPRSFFRDFGGEGRAHPKDAVRRFYALRYEQASNASPTVVVGDIFDSAVFSASGSPYLITNDVKVRTGAVLTVGAGVRVLFGPLGRITVEGELRVQGTLQQPAVFTSSKLFAQPGDWPGLRFSGVGAVGTLSNAVVEFAGSGISAVDASPTLSHVSVRRSRDHGLFLDRSSALVVDCLLERNGQDGIASQNRSAPQFLRNILRGNGRYGLSLSGGGTTVDQNPLALIRGNGLYENVQGELFTQNFFQPRPQTLDARSNWWGTAIAVDIPPRITDFLDRSSSPWVDWGNWLQSENGPATVGSSAFGNIEGSAVWRTADSPVWILGPLTVSTNASLRVERGVTARLVGNWRVDVFGSVGVNGTLAEPVLFTSGQPVPARGQWLGFRFNDSSVDASCVWSNVVVEYAQRGIECFDASPTLVGVTARENAQHGIYLERSSPLIQNGTMALNTQDGIQCAWLSAPRILGNVIQLNGSDGIELVGFVSSNRNSLPAIHGNSISGNATYDLQANNYFLPADTVINARSNWWGTAIAQQISTRILDFHDRTTSPWVDWGAALSAEKGSPLPGSSAVGPVVTDTVWRASDSPVRVIGNLLVASNATLRIEAGVEVRFLAGARLDVAGVLQAVGTELRPVVLTSGEVFPLPGDWEGIRFLGSSVDASCFLSNAVVEFARIGVSCVEASPSLVRCQMLDNSQHGLLLSQSAALVQQSALQYNQLDGIHCLSNSTPLVTQCSIQGNGSDGIELEGITTADRNSFPTIQGNALDGNVQFGLRINRYFRPAEVTIFARSNWWGSATPAGVMDAINDFLDTSTLAWVDWGNWLVSEDGPATPGTSVFGVLEGNRIWRTQDSPVWVLGPLTVATNAALSVERGVQVNVAGNWRADVFGSLAVNGTPESPVIFTSGQPSPARGQWLGVRFNDSTPDAACVWSNAIVEFAQRGIECFDSSPTFRGVTVRENSQHGIYLERSSPLIERGAVERNTLDGIQCVWLSSPRILGNLIRGNGSDGIEMIGFASSNRNSTPLILANRLEGNTNFAVNANTYFQSSNVVINARSNWWGTADGTAIPSRIFDLVDSTTAPRVDWGNWMSTEVGPAVFGRYVFGTITNAVTWTTSDRQVGVIGPLAVAPGGVLQVEPGVQVEFFITNGLAIDGALRALGTWDRPVLFTSGRMVPTNGSWGGIRFNPASSNKLCLISNAVVEYALTGIHSTQSDVRVANSHIRRNNTGLFFDSSISEVSSNLVEFNVTGLHCSDLSRVTVQGNTITLNANNGVNLTPSRSNPNVNPTTTLRGNSLTFNSTAGPSWFNLMAGTYAQPASVVINAVSNWWSGATDTNLVEGGVFHRRDASTSPFVDFHDPLAENPNFSVMGNRPSFVWFSPNQDGRQDELTVEARLSHTADWQVWILNDARDLVARFAGRGTDISLVWNGTNNLGLAAPEGRYRPVIYSTNLQSRATAVSHGDHFQLDRTPPISSASIPVMADGTVSETLDVLGSASDRSFAYSLVDYGVGVNPTVFTQVASNSLPPLSAFAQLNSRELENGRYLFRVRSYDQAGNVTETRIPVTIDNLSILDVEAASAFFDPGAGPASVSFNLTRRADVVFQVCRLATQVSLLGDVSAVTETNRILRSYPATLEGGAHKFTWDGRDSSGQPLTNGVYGFVLRASAELGRTDLFNPAYVAGPVSLSDFNYDTNFAFYANQPCKVHYTLAAPAYVVLAVLNRPYVVLWGDPRPAGTHHEDWNGRSSADRSLLYGDFRLGLKPQVLPENALVVNRPLNVIVTELEAESFIFTPTLSEVSEIRYALSKPATVTLQVREPNGNLLTMEDGKPQSGGKHRFEWGGASHGEQLVSVEGDYEIILMARDGASGVSETRTANVRVRK